jgi:hypothetical protein
MVYKFNRAPLAGSTFHSDGQEVKDLNEMLKNYNERKDCQIFKN